MHTRRLAAATFLICGLLSASSVEILAPTEGMEAPLLQQAVHDRRGVYLTCYVASRPGFLARTLDELERYGMDTVVVDVKNDHGEVSYASRVPLAHVIGAVTPRLELSAVVREIHARGMYAIARQVVARDPKLSGHLGSRHAPWVDVGDELVCQYNLALAREVEAAGFDEIQLDYIRYPDDGPIGGDHSARSHAVTAFVAIISEHLSISISVDLYGRVLWPWNVRHIDPIGQHLESLAAVAEVLSPMIYPSHYVEPEFKLDPYTTVRRAMEEGVARVATPIRPFLQAFDMALPPGMALSDYITHQIRAAESSGADGYLFWNPRADYTALWAALERMGRAHE